MNETLALKTAQAILVMTAKKKTRIINVKGHYARARVFFYLMAAVVVVYAGYYLFRAFAS